MQVIDDGPLPYLLDVTVAPAAGPAPVLCFLHGYDEAAPLPIADGGTRHGPLNPESAAAHGGRFILVAPQLPYRGDVWLRFAAEVLAIVEEVREVHGGDPARTCLTGFSYGGNGVFDLALMSPGYWAALWPVDPPRVPPEAPDAPVWLSVGAAARPRRERFVQTLALEDAATLPRGRRVWLDEGADHTGSARRAYADARIYDWLLSWELLRPAPTA